MNGRLSAYLDSLPHSSSAAPVDPLAGADPPGLSFSKQLRDAGSGWRVGALLGTHALATALLLASWAFIGFGALSGRLDYGWLIAWALSLASMIPLRAQSRWLEGVVAFGFGGLLKQRLLAGAIAMDAEQIRGRGAGRLMSEVLEAEAIDDLGASGGLQSMLALLDLAMVFCLLIWGAAAGIEMALLAGVLILLFVLVMQNLRHRVVWTEQRLGLTHQLIENMSAHRTRLAQQPASAWHREEDRDTERYAATSIALDRSTARITALLPRGYVMVAVATLAPAFIAGRATLPQLAITLGTLLFTAAALERLTFGIPRCATAWLAWRSVKPIFDAAARPRVAGVAAQGAASTDSVLQARELVFTHRGRTEPILKECSLVVERGDRILLEGETGSGKSTLAALLAGLRQPASGFILAAGLDRHTLGESAWRRQVATAPQYHENHILSASLGFNLLLGRRYPHSPQDMEDARQVCLELGLGALLERMPAGLEQIVGETGWRLSQGERSRVFLARALLQDAEIVLLDESLAALDPENLRQCLECVLRRVKTLMVIAHP